MQSPPKQVFYIGDDNESLTQLSPFIIIDSSSIDNDNCMSDMPLVQSQPDDDVTIKLLYTNICNDYESGIITPESKNSSNTSLLSDATTNMEHVLNDVIMNDKSNAIINSNNAIKTNTTGLLSTGIQMFVAFIVAGFGNVGAGLILDHVQRWSVFVRIPEMFVLVPSLLGLKGNLEMTMVARLSTHANLGNMNQWRETVKMAKGNMALVQCQATVVSFLAAIVAIVWNVFSGSGQLNINKCMVILSSSLITANVACFALGACMICVIVLSHKMNIDPDNIATPIAASLGDLTTAALLASFAQSIYNNTINDNSLFGFPLLSTCIFVVFIILLPLWFYYALTNEYTNKVVTVGWIPVIVAMKISSFGGFIFDYGVLHYKNIALFQPVINGVGGNLVAVQASRISTYLYRLGTPGTLFHGFRIFITPFKAFFNGNDQNVKTAQILLLMALPAHVLYVIVITLIKGESYVQITIAFFVIYLLVALLQVAILLYMAYILVHLLWRWRIDPDTFAIPLLTASGDFLGSAFLLFAFKIISLFYPQTI